MDRTPSSIQDAERVRCDEEEDPERDRSRERQDPEQAHHVEKATGGLHPRPDPPVVPPLGAGGTA